MLALCERGYTFSFLFTSRVDKFYHLNILYDGPSRQSLSPTSCAVFQLLSSLPSQSHRFILYCDNYFSNIPLFIALREYSIAACGTVRPTSAAYPVLFKIDKKKKCLAWNTLTAVAIGPVLAVLWQDKTLVRFLTTYHTCTPEPENFTSRLRRRPRITNANRQLVEAGWGGDFTRELRLPQLSVDYNDYMGRVDIADQRRSYYYTQLRTCRNWFPLFFWLLDTAVINCYLLAQEPESWTSLGASPPHESYWSHHGFFRTRLAWNLVLEGFRSLHPQQRFTISLSESATSNRHSQAGIFPRGNNSQSRRRGYVGKNYELDPRRKSPGNHQIEHGRKRLCLFCRYLTKHSDLHPSSITSSLRDRNTSEVYLHSFVYQTLQILNIRQRPNTDPFTPISPPAPSLQRSTQDAPILGKVRHTSFQCSFCKVPLCNSYCMRMYHELDI